jgi:AraC-like DNA-binding protein
MDIISPNVELHLVGHKRLGPWWGDRPIECPHWRLYWNDAPGAWLELENGSTHPIKPGFIHLLSPHLKGWFRVKGMPAHFFVHFLASQPFSRLPEKAWAMELTEGMGAVLGKVLRLLERGDSPSLELSLGCIALVSLALSGIPKDEIDAVTSLDARVIKAMNLMDGSGKALRNGELAKAVSMAENSFARLFRLETGMSPQDYSLSRRIDRARMMLQYGDASIKEIAMRCGFYDRYHFGRLFKEGTGESPAAYRKSRFPPPFL